MCFIVTVVLTVAKDMDNQETILQSHILSCGEVVLYKALPNITLCVGGAFQALLIDMD